MFKFSHNVSDSLKTYFKLFNNFEQMIKCENFGLSRKLDQKYASTSSVSFSNKNDNANSISTKVDFNFMSIVKKGYNIFLEECAKFKEEKRNTFILNHEDFIIRDPRHTINVFLAFENENSLDNFVVTTDSSNNCGFSSASLKITQDKTALFTGNISTEIPKTGNVSQSGFANMMTSRQMKSFFRPGYYDWRVYTHLVLKVRGDGRPYLIVLPTPTEYEELKHIIYMHPLYTRGGPYWQVTKIPFSHFYCLNKARLLDFQNTIPLNYVAKFGITLADGVDGPFKLEIDYVGLERLPIHKNVTPYESYYVGKI